MAAASVKAAQDRSIDTRTGHAIISLDECEDALAVLRNMKRATLGDCWEPCHLYKNMMLVKSLRDGIDSLVDRLSANKRAWKKRVKAARKILGAPIEETTDEALSRDIMDAPVLRGLTRMHEEARDALRAKLEIKLRTLWPESSLCIFGSSGSSLGSRTCDLDMTIVFASAAGADEGKDLNPASETVAHIEKLLRDEKTLTRTYVGKI